ncbi:MAG TPA: DUF4383 domain-containing protein [Chloroflexota bacterium]|nr:DUF4383 domain-containing protein [Chloroflexota bacterium]
MIRRYAQYMGIAIVLIGVMGLIFGNQSLLGLLNIDIVEDVIHLVTGSLMAYVGFRGSLGAIRAVRGIAGVALAWLAGRSEERPAAMAA